jgi:acetolactate synthase-1/2/3 large subunit
MKVSDYIVKCLELNNIETCFSITGGFSMHLNDSFGNSAKINTYYNHHEQACGYAAVGYTKTNNTPSVVCTTAGIAATNAISPCLIAYQDSLPILFINGQVKRNDTVRRINKGSSHPIRNYAFADCDIVEMVSSITKYSHEVTSKDEVPSVMLKLLTELTGDRPGPCWLSIPLDIQGSLLEDQPDIPIIKISKKLSNFDDKIYEYLESATRPLILAGGGIRLSNTVDKFNTFVNKYRIPVVTSLMGIDVIETDSNLFSGRVGIYGDRPGNFTVQNSDLIIALGCRLSQGVIGYDPSTFAREAKIVYVDIDDSEINKPSSRRYDLIVRCDLNVFFDTFSYEVPDYSIWVDTCNRWKMKWLYEIPSNIENTSINPYIALKKMFEVIPKSKNIVSMTGSIVTILWHMLDVKKNNRFVFNSQGDMGPELPAAVGCYIADPTKPVVVIVGEGSLQFNIQELQTIVHHKMPIKIVVFNNASYGAIDITQRTYFKNRFGIDSGSGISFPDTKKIANAYGIDYISANTYDDLTDNFITFFSNPNAMIFEIFCMIQGRCPKLSAIKNSDGSFTSRPFEDMEPLLNRDEFQQEMIIPII